MPITIQPHRKLFQRRSLLVLLAVIVLSIPVKLTAAQLLVWDIDFVPVISRGWDFLHEGTFPAYGTLSSVAAYNMPLLVWLQIPLLTVTKHVPTVLVGTQLIFNLLATIFLYRIGSRFFNGRIGLAAAALFTFSEIGISSAYTAWAQMLLPGFFIFTLYNLMQWAYTGRGWFLGGAILLATAATMTHFSAILLYPVIVVFGLLTHSRWSKRGLVAGLVGSLILLAPYIAFEFSRDFVDLRAFFTRQPTLSDDIIDSYAYLKPEAQAAATPSDTDTQNSGSQTDGSPVSVETTPQTQPSRVQRVVEVILSVPGQIMGGMLLAFGTQLGTLRDSQPLLYGLTELLRYIVIAAFFAGIIISMAATLRNLRGVWHEGADTATSPLRHRYRQITHVMVQYHSGRALVILACSLTIIGGLIVTRATPAQQPSYYAGLIAWEVLIAAYALDKLSRLLIHSSNIRGAMIALFVLAIAGLNSMDRIMRVTEHDPAHYSTFNIWLYDSVDDAVRYIGEDWTGGDTLSIRYDIMPENAIFWWVAPWHEVDPSYRIGMGYDLLLEMNYGLENTNSDPTGAAENPDYIVTYAPGLQRYDTDSYTVNQFGAIYVLKPEG